MLKQLFDLPDLETPAPSVFIGHGSPMNAIENNIFTQTMKSLGQKFKPQAILVISAHWLKEQTEVLLAEKPKTIYDFSGFPEELYQIKYNATGSEALTKKTVELLTSHHATPSTDWGLDHGAWSVLVHMYPQADIPVIQLSLNKNKSLKEQYELAKLLVSLRKKGVMIFGSGNLVHNLYKIDWNTNAKVYDWAQEFDEKIKEALLNDNIEFLTQIENQFAPQTRLAHPTIEHYLPMMYVLGAKTSKDQISFPSEGFQNASISMRSVLYSE